MSLFKAAKQRYTLDFPPVHGTLNEKKLLRAQLNEKKLLRAQQNQEGDTNTVYCHVIPLSGKHTMSFFNLPWF